jgi:hypothetical protein
MELAGTAWTLVSFETDMEVIPATGAPATLTFSGEGEPTEQTGSGLPQSETGGFPSAMVASHWMYCGAA